MSALHLWLARFVVLLAFAGFLLSLLRWQAASRAPARAPLRERGLAIVAVLTEVALATQAALGALLAAAQGHGPPGLHLMYGLLALVALPAAHLYAGTGRRGYAKWMAIGFLAVVLMAFRAASTAAR